MAPAVPEFAGLTVTEADAELLLALAVTVTAVSDETVPAVTVKLALLDPDATATDAGTVNAAWLSVNVTVTPAVGAAPLSVTVQPSVWVESTSELAHVNDVTVGGGATGGLTVNVAERELLLALAVRVTAVSDETVPAVTVKLALLDPDPTATEVGTVNAEWFVVSATVTPPDGAAPLSVTVQPSVWVEITCEAAHVSAVTVRSGALSASVKERELLLALAVRSTAVVALTADAADAVNPAVNDPDGTVTEEGIETLELFFERATACPPLGAAPLKVTVQLADPGGVSVPGVQIKLLTEGAGRGWGCEMVTVPLLPEDGIELPAADAADVFEICTTLDVAAVFEAMVRLTTATTPFAIEVILNPTTRQVIVPASVLHETDFSAAVAAPPAVTVIAENTDEEYPVVHCTPAG